MIDLIGLAVDLRDCRTDSVRMRAIRRQDRARPRMDPPDAAYRMKRRRSRGTPRSGHRHGTHQRSQFGDTEHDGSHPFAACGRRVEPGRRANRGDAASSRHCPHRPIRRGELALDHFGIGRDEFRGDPGREPRRLPRRRFRWEGCLLGWSGCFRRDRRLRWKLSFGVIGVGGVQSDAVLAVVLAAGGDGIGTLRHRDRPLLRALAQPFAAPGVHGSAPRSD